MNILLIKPKWFFPGGAYKFSATSRIAPLNLGIIAALSSTNGNNIKIIDEDVENIPDIISADLVGMTVATFTAPRAYLIAKRFKEKGTKIVTTFEAESENSIEMQRDGWQSILDNFKKYTESN